MPGNILIRIGSQHTNIIVHRIKMRFKENEYSGVAVWEVSLEVAAV
jgi:hypothetical protein